MIRSILGLAKFDSGNIKIFGKNINSNIKEMRERVGIVLDDSGFYEEFTMAEMKGIVAPAYKNWQEQDYKNCMEQFELNPKQKISTLSKGMKMKYALALALSHKAELLLFQQKKEVLMDNYRVVKGSAQLLNTVLIPILFMASILYRIYMPVQYMFGYEKSKLIFMFLLIAFPLLISRTKTANILVILSKMSYLIMLIAAIGALLLSLMASINIFNKKEL